VSPTEFDLRAALREGEGDAPNAERVLAGARAYRARRRSRMLSTAATVVCVAAVGGVVAGVLGTSGNGESGAGSMAAPNVASSSGAPHSAAGRSGVAPGRLNQPYGTTTLALPGCPTTRPDFTPPAGSSSAGDLLPEPVRSFVVCSYGSGSAAPNRLLVTGNDAVALAASLHSTLPHPLGVACPRPVGLRSYSLAMIGVTAPGKTLPTITARLTVPACNVVVTNATVVRYGWQPPQSLIEQLATLRSGPVEIPSSPVTPGHNEGSPVR
jgi:hypothetical protein